jgi:formate dehydrogenase alpha subunit
MSQVTLTIDGRQVTVPKGSTVLDACQAAGVDIPTLCYDPDLKPVGSCRLCVVECTNRWLMLASCVAPAEEGMEIKTNSPAVIEARKVNLELLTASHNFNCQVCERNGDCKLQDYCYHYGVETSRFTKGGRIVHEINDPNPFLERDYNKCIMCTKCVRACESITAARAISIENRGYHAKVATAFDKDLDTSSCVFCGQCIMVCPTGALTSKVSKGLGRAYEVERKVTTTCTYCGTGCTFDLDIKDDRVIGASSNRTDEYSPVNKGALCVKGRFGWDFVNSPDRLTKPLIKENGEFREASWDEALDLVAARLSKTKEVNGPNSIATFVSARMTNEDNYIAQKFARTAIGTNNVDHCARL